MTRELRERVDETIAELTEIERKHSKMISDWIAANPAPSAAVRVRRRPYLVRLARSYAAYRQLGWSRVEAFGAARIISR